MLARLYRSGHLTAVHVPDEGHEALRRLLRLRETYHAYCTATMHRISGILRNHGHLFKQGKSIWTKKHRRWLGELRHSLQGPLQTTLAAELQHLEYLETEQAAFDAELQRYAALPLKVTPHVAQNIANRSSTIDGRTTRHAGYEVSQRKRKRVEEIFGWVKTIGLMRKTRHRGRDRVGWMFRLALALYNMVRIRNILNPT